MFNSYVIEVPNTNIREERTSLDECWDICYDLAQEYGLAEVVFYALNGNRVVQDITQTLTKHSVPPLDS